MFGVLCVTWGWIAIGTLKCLGSTAPSYVAPEAKKRPTEYYDGGPADIWAAGIVLLHLLLDAPSILQSVEWNHQVRPS